MFGQLRQVNAISELNISNSSVLRSGPGINESKFENRWALAESLQRKGEYLRAVEIRKETLSELYKLQGINQEAYFPPLLSTHWVSNFGHLAVLGHHVLARQVGLIPRGLRTVVGSLESPNKKFLEIVTQNDQYISHPDGNRWSEIASFWGLAERLRLVKSNYDFIDISQMIEDVHNRNFNPIELPQEYVDSSLLSLKKYGIQEDSKFVALHIRESITKRDPRSQPVESFQEAIKEILRAGYKILRIGDLSSKILSQSDDYLDLTTLPNLGKELHAFALARCEFFLGTQSGPSLAPRIFGKPSLLTNMTEIGTSVTSSTDNSIYLPKKWIKNKNNEPLSLAELFQTKLAFAASDPDILSKTDCRLEPNTPHEILDATREIIEAIRNSDSKVSDEQNLAKQIMTSSGSPGRGNFSQSYLSKNFSWFLEAH